MASTRATVNPSPVITRAAVVIGVNNTGGLTPLRAAVSGAKEVQRWLAAEPEKFEVTALLDTGGEVTIEAVKRAVRKYVDLGRYCFCLAGLSANLAAGLGFESRSTESENAGRNVVMG